MTCWLSHSKLKYARLADAASRNSMKLASKS